MPSANSPLRFAEPLGHRPSLEWRRVAELAADPSYQRSIDTKRARDLIHRIARGWDWNLCQPLAIARRGDGSLRVVDGQHRLAAARLRDDIHDLPCVVTAYADAGAEAAAFVALNSDRRALSKLELFKAALISGDEEAGAVMALIEGAGLTLAQHTNWTAWRPAAIANVPGIVAGYRKHGADVTRIALRAIAGAFPSQVLRFAGTIYPGLAAFIADEAGAKPPLDEDLLVLVLQGADQQQWVSEIMLEQAATGGNRRAAARAVFQRAYAEAATEMEEAA